MKITLHGGTLEHIRDALDAVVEGTDAASALRGMGFSKLAIGDGNTRGPGPTIMLMSADEQTVAQWDNRCGHWERSHVCDECGREEWSEHAEHECNCVVEPTRNDPEGWME